MAEAMHNSSMESRKPQPQRLYSVGLKVEVTTNEEGFRGSWYTGTIVNPSFQPKPKTAKNFFWVQYEGLVTEDDPLKPLIECIPVSNLRPLPPRDLTDHKGVLELDDVVEASYRDGWWTGVIIEVFDDDGDGGGGGLRFVVAFECPYEEIEFGLHELRLHLDWVDGEWVRPQKKEVVALKDTRETELASQLESVFTEDIARERILSCTKNLKKARTDSESAKPLKKLKKARTDPGSAKPLEKLKKARTYSEGTKPQKKLKRENAPGASAVLTPCGFHSTSIEILGEEADGSLVSTDKGDGKVDVNLKSLDRHKHSTKSLSPVKNSECNEANGGKSDERTKMGRQRKELLQRFLTSLQGDERTGEGENVHEKAIVLKAASEAEFVQATGTREEPSGEAFVLSETDSGNRTHEIETALDIQGVCTSNAIALCPISRDQQESVVSCTSVIAGTATRSEGDQCWPFIKSSGIWKTIDSMDIFSRMPQMPHFFPLNEYEENSREKLAIGLMMKFAYEVDKISRLSPADLKNKRVINDSLDSLRELESHGFDIMGLKAYLNHLLRESELQEKLEEVESKISRCETEKTAAENEINKLVEQLKSLEGKLESAKSMKSLKDLELADLESEKGIVSGEIQSLQLDFRRKAAEAALLCEVASESPRAESLSKFHIS